MLLFLKRGVPIIPDTNLKPPKIRHKLFTHRVSALITSAFFSLSAMNAFADADKSIIIDTETAEQEAIAEFSYELTATGTESPDVTFSVELTAIGKETVIKYEQFTDNFPALRAKRSRKRQCSEAKRQVCLPANCQLDKTQGDENGYSVDIYSEKGVEERSHTFDEDSNCLTSYVRTCNKKWWGETGKYGGNHTVFGKCTYTESWTRTQERGPFSITEADGFINLGRYDGSIGSPNDSEEENSETVAGSAYVDSYDVVVVSKTPSDASLQIGMFKDEPSDNLNGEDLWAKTDYRIPWSSNTQGTASIFSNGIEYIDSIQKTAPNADTTYTVSMTIPSDSDITYTQNDNGLVDTGNLVGWLTPNQKFFVATDQDFANPQAIIDKISPNPALLAETILFEGHGEQGNNPIEPTIITTATWHTNRPNTMLHICTSPDCYFESNKLKDGQHLIHFQVNSLGVRQSPIASQIININQTPLASIISVQAPGKTNGKATIVQWNVGKHDPISFVGQAVDRDGTITKYRWESNRDGLLSYRTSFTTTKLSLGKHIITFYAIDNNKQVSNVVTTEVEVIKPPTLLVYETGAQPDTWNWKTEARFGEIQELEIEQENLSFLDGSKQVSEKVAELTEEYGVAKINIVAHSLGYLTAKWYLDSPSYRDDVNELILPETEVADFRVEIVKGTKIEAGISFSIKAYAQTGYLPFSGLEVNAQIFKSLTISNQDDPESFKLGPFIDLNNGQYEYIYSDPTPGVYYVFATATEIELADETESDIDTESDTDIESEPETLEAFTSFVVEESNHDLSVSNLSFANLNNDITEVNETITITATIDNESRIDAENVKIWFADGSLDEDGTVFAQKTIDIKAKGSQEVSTRWQATAGTQEIFVIVNPMNAFIEKNLDNNIASQTITLISRTLIAEAGPDQLARFDTQTQANVPIFLDGSGSRDEWKMEQYQWDLDTTVDDNGDGISDNDVNLTGIHPIIPAGTYTELGDYEVKLTVVNTNGQSSSDTLLIQLTEDYDLEAPRVVEAGMNQTIASNTPVDFDGSNSRDNYGIATYSWDIDINTDSNGDNIPNNDVDLVGMQPTLVAGYPNENTYTVQLTVRDVAGNDFVTDSLVVTVDDNASSPNYSAYGSIRDSFNQPLQNVNLLLDETGNPVTTSTDAEGYWKISGLAAGTYTLQAQKAGYSFEEASFTVSKSKPNVAVNITASLVLQVEVIPYLRMNTQQENNSSSYLKALNANQTLAQGENLIYLITVTNDGSEIAKDVMLTETLPEGGELISLEALTGGSCDLNTMTCNLLDLPKEATATVKVEISNTQKPSLFFHKATVTAAQYPATVQITQTEIKPYLSLSLNEMPEIVEMLSLVRYTVNVELNQHAPSAATEVELVMTLSPEVELQSIKSDKGDCDTDNFPVVICTFSQLSADSQTTVNLDIALADERLLLVTNQVELSSNEYPTQTLTEKTPVLLPEDTELDIAFVIDVANSMQAEISEIRKKLLVFMATQMESSAVPPLTALITFANSIKLKAFTDELDELQEAVEILKVEEGTRSLDSETLAVEALKIIIPHLKSGGKLLFATDAPWYLEPDIEDVKEQISAKQICLDVTLIGNCSELNNQNGVDEK